MGPLMAYGTLRLPLAWLELPLFVLLPALYGRAFGLDLATIGIVLFATRLVDAIADPLIGATIDTMRPRWDLRRWVLGGLPLLAIGFTALLLPPVRGDALAGWLAAASILTYLAFSTVSIAYLAWGSGIGRTQAERARVTTVREAFGLLGVLGAASLLVPERAGMLAAAFALLAALAGLCLRAAPAPWSPVSWSPMPAGLPVPATRDGPPVPATRDGLPVPATREAFVSQALAGWRRLRDHADYRWLMAAFVLNGVATAIPATLVLFFVDEVLGVSGDESAAFLVTYFVAGAVGMPVWLAVARRWGLRNAWLLGMALSVIAFVWTLGLGHGDVLSFHLVCAATGLALGSDLAMPPALLATVIAGHGAQGRDEGAYFGLWQLATKLNLALAAGLALPAVQWMREVDVPGDGALGLTLVYAALPSLLKLMAGGVLLLAPLPEALRDGDTPVPSSHDPR